MKKTVKNLITWSPSHLITSQKSAFTLAEVLITLGIIGVVAAMTIPTLISNYNKKVVEVKLQKMYALMSNAIAMSVVDHGETISWNYTFGDSSTPYSDVLAWYNKYLAPYLKVTKVEQEEDTENLLIYLLDGSIVKIENIIYDWHLYTNKTAIKTPKVGVSHFMFRFQPKLTEAQVDDDRFANVLSPTINSYGYCWDGTYEGAKYSSCNNGCYQTSALCAKLIHLNGWKIPNDYPYKF